MLGLYLIFSNSPDKLKLSILTVVLPFIIYGFVRLLFRIISKNASKKVILIFSYFFLVACTLGIVMAFVSYITNFPNGYSPTISAELAVIFAILDYNSKI